MSDYDEDKLAEDVCEFDRLMAADDDVCQSTYETPDFVVIDDFSISGAKPLVNTVDADHGAIELVQLPVPDDTQKSKHPV